MKKINFVMLLLGLLVIGFSSTLVFAQVNNPPQSRTDEYRRKGPCNDAWISIAFNDTSRESANAVGFGDYAQCNKYWYNNGSWSSYNELFEAVREAKKNWANAGIAWTTKFQSNGTAVFYANIDGSNYGALAKGVQPGTAGRVFQLIGNDGGTLVGNDGASLISNANGLIGNDSAGLVGAGGWNLKPMAANSFGLNSGSVRKRIKIGPNTYMVLKR